jgi:hypothetical protein
LIETLAADEGAAATRQTAPNSVIQEHDPSFYDAGYPDNPFLLTLAGPTRVCDPLVPSSCEDGAHGHIVRVWTGTQLSPPDAARRLALPLGFGSSSADQEPSTGQFLMSYLGGVGSAATRFINRVFFFTPSRTVGEFSEALAATWSYSPTGDEPWGRNVGLAVAGPRRLAPIVFPDPARGEALLLFSANGDVRMSYRWSM